MLIELKQIKKGYSCLLVNGVMVSPVSSIFSGDDEILENIQKELEIKKMPRTKKTKLIEDGIAGDFKISRRKNNIKINSMQI